MSDSPFAARLQELERQSLLRRHRVVAGPTGTRVRIGDAELLAFCSNDYLGLANHPEIVEAAAAGLRRYGVGAGSSALVTGHMEVHEALTGRLARFVGLPSALLFSSGYLANVGTITALAGPGDAIFSDALNHASLIDGCRLSRAAVHRYPHRDLAALEQQLAGTKATARFVVSDIVFSMDGDIAPLPELAALCERHGAWLVVDDAHGFGVLGREGRGSLAHFGVASPRLVYVGTLGKAAGVAGAFVAGPRDAVEVVLQSARTHIFSTAFPPALAHALLTSLDVIARDEWRRTHLAALVARLRAGAKGLPWRLLPSETPIQPLVVGDNAAALALAEALRARGVLVPAIRPPTVPPGTARLRISLSAAHTLEDVDALVAALRDAAAGRRGA
ncbi:MAG: 8-amino-7-oxononanoate synthase [Burkholderiales bacterium]|nr:8-amino-7-oxononanoate synthase [Burkholderiales bacterium]